jgi:hypothetical protein
MYLSSVEDPFIFSRNLDAQTNQLNISVSLIDSKGSVEFMQCQKRFSNLVVSKRYGNFAYENSSRFPSVDRWKNLSQDLQQVAISS